MKPFNLEEARAGKPVVTRSGKGARIVCFDRNINSAALFIKKPTLIVLVEEDGYENVYTYNDDGTLYTLFSEEEKFSDKALVMKPEKKMMWANIYKSDSGGIYIGSTYQSKEESIKYACAEVVTQAEVIWDE